ncbi:MAG TPA: hypothetical protein VFH47_01760 [Candidatus Thermoplasmatota archaeon]|nr:hypothetical protein [Candidatus Thermoplasmatota archaeon]
MRNAPLAVAAFALALLAAGCASPATPPEDGVRQPAAPEPFALQATCGRMEANVPVPLQRVRPLVPPDLPVLEAGGEAFLRVATLTCRDARLEAGSGPVALPLGLSTVAVRLEPDGLAARSYVLLLATDQPLLSDLLVRAGLDAPVEALDGGGTDMVALGSTRTVGVAAGPGSGQLTGFLAEAAAPLVPEERTWLSDGTLGRATFHLEPAAEVPLTLHGMGTVTAPHGSQLEQLLGGGAVSNAVHAATLNVHLTFQPPA